MFQVQRKLRSIQRALQYWVEITSREETSEYGAQVILNTRGEGWLSRERGISYESKDISDERYVAQQNILNKIKVITKLSTNFKQVMLP